MIDVIFLQEFKKSFIQEVKTLLVKPTSPKLNQTEAQKYVGLGRDTFNREVALGRIKKHIGPNGYVYFLRYELDKYLER
jgi:hypothetical protein